MIHRLRHPSRVALPVLAALAALCLLLPGGRGADTAPAAGDPGLRAAAALYDGIRAETLDNGLRVYLKPIPEAPVVTTMMAYRVGSADEELSQTGLSHYLEHLMFKGTDKLQPGDIDRLTLRNGGACNAYTTQDYTVFHFDFAADRWEVALEIEADRMRNLRIDTQHEFEKEKQVVISELAGNEDQPWDLEQKAILPLLFGKKHPYGHPIIGERQHVKDATADVIKGHYDRWYHPNNAALVVVGGFDPDKALARIKKLFGPIPSAKLPERRTVPDEKVKRPARLEMDSKFDVPRLLLGFAVCDSKDPDSAVLDVVQSLLAGGKTGRLYRRLVTDDDIASEVGAGNQGGRYPGWFNIQVQANKDAKRKKVEDIVLEELQRLAEEPVTAAELKRVRQSLLTDAVFGRESVHDLADSIARSVVTYDADYLKAYLPRVLGVTAADVQRVVKKYFDPDKRVVVWSLPKKAEGRGTMPGAGKVRAARDGETPAVGSFSLKDAKRVELPNGLVLLLYENHRLPLFVAQAVVRRGQLHEPADKAGVATLTGYLLEEGTASRSSQKIAETIEDAGGNLSMSATGGTVKVLASQREVGLSLLLECLSRPSFPKEAFERQKDRLLGDIEDAEKQPDTRAQRVFYELAYSKHPLGRPELGKKETVEALTRDDCSAFHRKVFVPNNTILAVVGDFDSKAVVEEVTQLTAGWKKAELPRPETPPVTKPAKFTEKIVTLPDAAQMQVYLGHAGIRRNNPDYYKLLVMDYVLGTGPGFSNRLSARLRDREGLGYTVDASITGTAGEEPGLFSCYIDSDAKNFARVKELLLEELNRFRADKPSAEEVEDAKKYLLGNLPFKFATSADVAGQLLSCEQHGLGFGYLDDYRKAVAAVTPEDVLAVARKYLDPEHMILVAAGAIDQNGKPLDKTPKP
jgi:zinc protease